MAAATGYRVRVYASGYRKVAESPLQKALEWHSTIALPRGQVYSWTVTAEGPQGQVRQPAPPQPEAEFQVMAEGAAADLNAAASSHAANHLLLAVLYARAGALNEARAQVDQLAGQNPNSPLVAELRASLDQGVPSPISRNAAQ
jgi:hypothetical protein